MTVLNLDMLNELMTVEDGKLVIQHGSDGFRGKFVDDGDILIYAENTHSLHDVLSKLEVEALGYLTEATWSGVAGAIE